jgi:hypothetical protein
MKPDQDSNSRCEDNAQDSVKTGAEGVRVEGVEPEHDSLPSAEETTRDCAVEQTSSVPTAEVHGKPIREAVWGPFLRETRDEWKKFLTEHSDQWGKIMAQRNRCAGALVVMFVYCGLGGLLFRFTEGAFEAFYKCGVKRVKRDFVDSLWLGSHHLPADEWKSQARRKLMELETQLLAAHEAGVTTYSGQRAWSFLNAVVYCLTVVTTIGKAPARREAQCCMTHATLFALFLHMAHISRNSRKGHVWGQKVTTHLLPEHSFRLH